MSKVIRKSCAYIGWFAEYSMDTCDINPKFIKDGCAGCRSYITRRQLRIKTIKDEIARLQKELAVLTKGKKENSNGNDK